MRQTNHLYKYRLPEYSYHGVGRDGTGCGVFSNFEIVSQSPVLDVFGSVIIQFVFVEPFGIVVAVKSPLGSFAKAKEIVFAIFCGILDIKGVPKVKRPEVCDNLLDVGTEFTSVRKLIRRTCAVEVFTNIFEVGRNRCLVNVPVERNSEGEILTAPIQTHYAVFITVTVVVLL